jgi:type I restriction enzyme, S subunit
MGLCDELEAKLRKEREESQKLVEAVVKGLLEGSATQSELDRRSSMQEAVIPLK